MDTKPLKKKRTKSSQKKVDVSLSNKQSLPTPSIASMNNVTGAHRKAKRKIRQIIRRQKRSAVGARDQVDKSVDVHFLRRLNRLLGVRRFVVSWLMLAALLIAGVWWQVPRLDQFYLRSAPSSGGTYREGIVGTFTNASPLYATNRVDTSVSRLVFNGLFEVDGSGVLLPSLATSIDIDETKKIYTAALRRDVRWHDGEEFNADDVVFTYNTIKNTDARSPLQASWRSVKVEAIDSSTVRFTLPNIYSAFPYSLTNGIVPEHLLANINLTDLRSSSFNTTETVGTGMFKLQDLQVVSPNNIETRSERIVLKRNDDYFGEIPHISGIVMRTYRSEDLMIKAFEDSTIQAMVGVESQLEYVSKQEDVRVLSAPLTSAVMTFFNTSNSILKDRAVRQALVQATNVEAVRGQLDYAAAAVDSPFLRGQYTYDAKRVQLGYDVNQAEKKLEQAGWLKGEDGLRRKDGAVMKLRLFSQSSDEYSDIVSQVQSDWASVGVVVDVFLQAEEDIQSGAIARHDYDVLVYGISLGYDPDVYAYWHSSQANPVTSSGLNLSEYKNEDADESLEAGRTRSDEQLRSVKYEPFVDAWIKDAPAFGLYQPRFVMVVSGTFEGFEQDPMRSGVDRFRSISNWRIRNAKVPLVDI